MSRAGNPDYLSLGSKKSVQIGDHAYRKQKTELDQEGWLLGKRRDWDEFIQNIMLDTKARVIKKARAEAAQEMAMDIEDGEYDAQDEGAPERKEAAGGFSQRFKHDPINSDAQDSWNQNGKANYASDRSNTGIHNPFSVSKNGHEDGPNEETQVGNLRAEHPNDNGHHPFNHDSSQRQIAPSYEKKFAKKQLFDSDSDEEERPRGKAKALKANQDQGKTEDIADMIGEVGSPVASIEFQELGQAPAFNF